MKNAFTLVTDFEVFKNKGISAVTAATDDLSKIKNNNDIKSEFYRFVHSGNYVPLTQGYCGVYAEALPFEENEFNKLADYIIDNGIKLMIPAHRDLYEVGRFDAKYGLTPVMLMHKLGILKNAVIIGGIYLDNDEIDLMAQENASLVLTPTYDFGKGSGIPNVVNYLKRGLKIKLGTADNSFNKQGDLRKEAELLFFVSNASLCRENSISPKELEEMLSK